MLNYDSLQKRIKCPHNYNDHRPQLNRMHVHFVFIIKEVFNIYLFVRLYLKINIKYINMPASVAPATELQQNTEADDTWMNEEVEDDENESETDDLESEGYLEEEMQDDNEDEDVIINTHSVQPIRLHDKKVDFTFNKVMLEEEGYD